MEAFSPFWASPTVWFGVSNGNSVQYTVIADRHVFWLNDMYHRLLQALPLQEKYLALVDNGTEQTLYVANNINEMYRCRPLKVWHISKLRHVCLDESSRILLLYSEAMNRVLWFAFLLCTLFWLPYQVDVYQFNDLWTSIEKTSHDIKLGDDGVRLTAENLIDVMMVPKKNLILFIDKVTSYPFHWSVLTVHYFVA